MLGKLACLAQRGGGWCRMPAHAEFWECWVEGILPLSLTNPLHCFSTETSDPQQQPRRGVLRELGVPQGAPLAAPLVTGE